MGTKLLTIARVTFIEALRQPIFFLLTALCGVLVILVTWSSGFSMQTRGSSEVIGDNRMLLEVGLATVFACATVLAAFICTATISREIENKTALTIVSKPVARVTVVIGKYLGVSAAILIASITMIFFLLMALRHGVLSTAADDLDGPVIVFSSSAFALAFLLGAWCNFFYGWSFTQTASLLLLPFTAIAFVLVLALNKEWAWQPLATDFMPRITLACASTVLAILVLAAVATAVSTRLGQVMTIVVCAGVFVLGLVSNQLTGTAAFANKPVAYVREAISDDPADTSFAAQGATYTIVLDGPVLGDAEEFVPGDSFYYGSNANGIGIAVHPFRPFEGNPAARDSLIANQVDPAIIVTAVDGLRLSVRQVGRDPVRIDRPPQPGDAIFRTPTTIRPLPLAAWAATPNLQHFWLIDAVTQNRTIPNSHLALTAGYALSMIVAFLSLGVFLFQTRDVG